MLCNRQQQPSIVLNVEQFIYDVEKRPAIWNRNYHCNKQFMEQTWDELSDTHKLPKQILKNKWKGLRDNFRVEYKRIPRNEFGEMTIPPEAHDSKWTHYHSLLFLVDHMRHRHPKFESQPYYNLQYSNNPEEYEETLVEPDLTNGLIQLAETESLPAIQNISFNGGQTLSSHPECSSNDSTIFSNSCNGSNKNYLKSEILMSSKGIVPAITIKRKRFRGDNHGNYNTDDDDEIAMIDTTAEPDDDYYYLLSLHPYMKQLNASQKLRLRTKIQKLIFKELYKEDIEEVK